ncbi:hypothetical protein [Persephonella sp.]
MVKLVFVLIFLIFSGCGYKPAYKTEGKKEVYCIKSIKFPRAEATALDVFSRSVSDAVISSGNTLECSGKTTRFIKVYVKSLSISPIGYSAAQRASIYRVTVYLDFIVENRKNEIVFKKSISEMAQYTGTGLTGDVERRYAVEEVGRLVSLRIFSILTDQ